jgi:nucleotide-binding universal stress UspA family protein
VNEDPQANRPILVGLVSGQPDDVLINAARLAKDLSTELVCAHVDADRYAIRENPDGSVTSIPLDPDLAELDDDGIDPELAAHVGELLSESGVAWSFRALAGDPAHALSHLANTIDARVIVVGTHHPGRRSGVRDFFRGSIAAHLTHRQHRPVLVVPLSPVTDGGTLPWE